MSRLSSDDWLALVEIARRAISSAILEKRIPDFPSFPAALTERRGAFVSLYYDGALRGASRGLLLPQVAAERSWSSQRLLEETCVKAGLPRDAWRDPETQVFGFTAEVSSRKRPRPVPGS